MESPRVSIAPETVAESPVLLIETAPPAPGTAGNVFAPPTMTTPVAATPKEAPVTVPSVIWAPLRLTIPIRTAVPRAPAVKLPEPVAAVSPLGVAVASLFKVDENETLLSATPSVSIARFAEIVVGALNETVAPPTPSSTFKMDPAMLILLPDTSKSAKAEVAPILPPKLTTPDPAFSVRVRLLLAELSASIVDPKAIFAPVDNPEFELSTVGEFPKRTGESIVIVLEAVRTLPFKFVCPVGAGSVLSVTKETL